MHRVLYALSYKLQQCGFRRSYFSYPFSLVGLLFIQFSLAAQNPGRSLFNIEAQSFTERWELDSASRNGTFRLVPYKPIYFLLANWSSNPNKMPQSENPDFSVSEEIPLNATELKFQISFKTKVLEGIFGGHGDLWAAYTQSSRW